MDQRLDNDKITIKNSLTRVIFPIIRNVSVTGVEQLFTTHIRWDRDSHFPIGDLIASVQVFSSGCPLPHACPI